MSLRQMPLDRSHSVSLAITAGARAVFDFMADPIALGGWSLGCMGTVPDGPFLHRGRSLYDGGEGWIEIDTKADVFVVDYLVGTRDHRSRRISARVLPGRECALPEGQCYLTLTAWRPASMEDARWQRLCAAHEAEIWIIKAQIESGYRPASVFRT